MADVRTKFVNSFNGQSKDFGVRLDMLSNMQLFKTRNDIKSLMKFFNGCGIKFLNMGSIFAHGNEKTISSFAIDENILSPAVLGGIFPAKETIGRIMDFFDKHNTQTLRTEFTNFCDKHSYWLEEYSLYRALSDQIGTYDFSQWPDIIKAYSRRIADIVKKQLPDRVLFYKILQFFAYKQLKLIKDCANEAGIFLCGDCDLLCENLSADVWKNQKMFFINDISKATVFVGFPPSDICKEGLKSTKVPYRISFLQNNHYEFFENMFTNGQTLFDAIFLLNGHSIFQYWEIASSETDPKHGRWVNAPTDTFFQYLDSHFNNFPYLFDFNEPLFASNEIISKRHSMLQVVIDGEPTAHACSVYNLQRQLFAVSTHSCNRKISKIHVPANTIIPRIKSCLDNYKKGTYQMCILHFDEICGIVRCSPDELINDPVLSASKFVSSINGQRFLATPKTSHSSNRSISKQSKQTTSRLSFRQKAVSFLKNLFK
ncbi:MAG: 4-alpha-glucanotransferase [Puniceicoccales bacterium]|nr:4-alpha-glucanotransferase [Puniceicoccales bacterium]